MKSPIIKKYLNSTYFVYFCFFVMLVVMLFAKNIHFEPIEAGAIRQILHPEFPKGELSYAPYYHYDYIVVSVAKWLGYGDNFGGVARIFWFLEMALAVVVLIKLCNFIFKNDKLILVMAVMMFILSQSGQIDQKTMARPLYLLAIYYFLREKWLISAIFGAFIFYLHVGLAVWWFLPSCFALAVIFLIHKRISLKRLINYSLAVIILAFPIIYFYLGRTGGSGADEFSVNYIYHTCWHSSSVLLTLSNLKSNPMMLMGTLLMVAVFLTGYSKARNAGYKNGNIMPIAIGVLVLYIVNFIFADILRSSTAITLQLLRSVMYVEFFASLFFAFLLAKQVRRNNYIFFLIFILVSFNYPLLRRFFGNENQLVLLNIFYFALLIYEIFEMRYLKGKIAIKGNRLLQRPVVISVFLIFVTIPQLQVLKLYVRSVLNIPYHGGDVACRKDEYLHKDIADFTNKNIDDDALLLIPFYETDFEFYAKHKVFITCATPYNDIQYGNKAFKLKDVLEDDLNYSTERFFERYGDKSFGEKWEEMWKNLDENVIRYWKRKYGMTHVIREKELPLDLPILYQNQFYVIYEIN